MTGTRFNVVVVVHITKNIYDMERVSYAYGSQKKEHGVIVFLTSSHSVTRSANRSILIPNLKNDYLFLR